MTIPTLYCSSYDGEYVVTGGTAGMLRLWRLVLSPTPSLQIVFEARAHSKSITAVQFGAHDKQVVSAGLDGCIFCWWFNK
ncbi:hypothetical protein EON63_07780 [archaeon]|nr:MAG: hypothetical protein EON63_07780 [archaeon]